MKRLYAPWRSRYLKKKDEQCPFCSAVETTDDTQSLVLARRELVLIMMNRYPYNAGHLLVIPHQHTGDPSALSAQTRAALMEACTEGITLLEKVLHCQGVNAGFNVGPVSGGSIPDHFHFHVVPRWQGDAGFLTTMADTKLISFDLYDIYQKLKHGLT